MHRFIAPLVALFAILILGATTGPARAAWPERPINFVIPFATGGSADALGRLFAERLSSAVGQPVIVDNRPGAGGNTGTGFVAKAAPDGYTLLFTSTSYAINPSLYASVPYDIDKDFAAVALMAVVPNMLVIHPALPFKTVPELVAYAKANPGKLNFGSSGNGTSVHLAGELFKSLTQIDIVHVPYRGAAAALTDLLSGNIQMLFDTTPSSIPHVQSGRLRVLGIATQKRLPELPEVPTFGELGYPSLVSGAWVGILVPAGTPRAIVERINKVYVAATADPVTVGKLHQMGAQELTGSPEDVAKFLKAEQERWGGVIKASGAKID
jgi:tripartite-type tricarboxylate transporter receptor subunit TctC